MSKLTAEQIGMDRISPSQLMEFNDCPRLFYYKSWLGLKLPQDKRHLEFGTAFHAAIDNIYAQYDNNFGAGWQYAECKQAEKTFKQKFKITAITDDEFNRVLKMKSNKFKTKEEMFKSMTAEGISMIRHFWDEKESLLLKGIDIDQTELSARLPLCNPNNPDDCLPIPLSLRIDASTRGKKKIVEFKTSSGKYNEEETRKKLQGRSYAFAYLTSEKKMPESVDYIVCLKGKKREIQHIPLVFDLSDMAAYYHEVEVILQKIANREFGRGNPQGFVRMELERYEEALGINN